jgi:hypothetical protein
MASAQWLREAHVCCDAGPSCWGDAPPSENNPPPPIWDQVRMDPLKGRSPGSTFPSCFRLAREAWPSSAEGKVVLTVEARSLMRGELRGLLRGGGGGVASMMTSLHGPDPRLLMSAPMHCYLPAPHVSKPSLSSAPLFSLTIVPQRSAVWLRGDRVSRS